MRNLLFFSVLLILLVALILPACGKPKEENVIRVAIVGPMQFVQGEHHWMGASMAADEINNAGGVDIAGTKYMIKLIQVDSNEILDVAGVAVTPGIDFGPGGEGFIRISYANSMEHLDTAITRLEKYFFG